MFDSRRRFLACSLALFFACTAARAQDKIKVLLIDGQNNHQWKVTTPLIKAALEGCGRFAVDVATTPPKGTAKLEEFHPNFKAYGAVVSNYNGAPWPAEVQKEFVEYVAGGGGFVSVHAADNSFAEWPEYNEMIGLGGWGGRNEKSGPYLRLRDGKWTTDETKGGGGTHGKQHEFLMETRAAEHPIMKGLPEKWRHAKDELYGKLRGPAKNVTVLASSFSDPATGGTKEDEPLLMVIDYGKGRVFHDALGHGVEAMNGVGFQVTLQRGTEWAATGKVTLPAPSATDLPTDKAAMRDPATIKP